LVASFPSYLPFDPTAVGISPETDPALPRCFEICFGLSSICTLRGISLVASFVASFAVSLAASEGADGAESEAYLEAPG
jgi:hypothetical protein